MKFGERNCVTKHSQARVRYCHCVVRGALCPHALASCYHTIVVAALPQYLLLHHAWGRSKVMILF